jgi:hypothetical protein
LAMPVQPRVIGQLVVEQAHRTRPELMMFGGGGAGQSCDRLRRRNRAGIPGLADDPDEAVLSDRARRPAVDDLGTEPCAPGVSACVSVRRASSTALRRRCGSRRARSLTAIGTSSSIDRVVRMHLMLLHQRSMLNLSDRLFTLPNGPLDDRGAP